MDQRAGVTDRVLARTVGGLALPCVAAALLLGACGSDDNKSDSAKTSGQAKTTPAASAPKSHGTADVSGKRDAEMELDDNYFSPTIVKGKPGQTVTLNLKNEGKAEHTFTLASQKIDKELEPDAKAVVSVKLPRSGSIQFICRYHAKLGMRGSLAAGSSTGGSSSGGSSGSGSSGGSGH